MSGIKLGLKLLDKEQILQISRETKGSEAYVKRFDGYQHLVVMLFGILKHFDSLRELEIGMKAEAHKLGHLGMNYLVRRSTLAEANIRRPQEFFASVYAYLLEKYARFLADSRNEVSCRRADGGAVHIRRQTRRIYRIYGKSRKNLE